MKERIKPTEWGLVALVTALLLLVSSVPYIAGHVAENNEVVYSGAVIARPDYSVYIAAMQYGSQGAWTNKFRMTGEPHEGTNLRTFYVFLGHAAAALDRYVDHPVVVTYHLARIFFGALAAAAIYVLLAQIFETPFARMTAFLLAMIASGLGWLQLVTGWLPQPDISPIDFWLLDGYPFLILMLFPHFSFALAGIAAMLAGFLRFLQNPKFPHVWPLVGIGLVTQYFQPFAPLLADVAIGGAFLIAFKNSYANAEAQGMAKLKGAVRALRVEIWALGIIAVSQVPLLVSQARMLQGNPFLAEFSRQNLTLSPPFAYYLWGFGVLWVLALIGVFVWGRNPSPAFGAVILWVVGALFLAYMPWALQRRFLLGYTIPLSILSIKALQHIFGNQNPFSLPVWLHKRKVSVVILLISFASVSSLLLSFGNGALMFSQPDTLFDSSGLIQAVDWLSQNAAPDDVVVSMPDTGVAVASRGGLVVYIGHAIETMFYEDKLALVNGYFSGEMDEAEAETWLDETGGQWLVFGPNEILNNVNPEALSAAGKLEERFRTEDTTVYGILP